MRLPPLPVSIGTPLIEQRSAGLGYIRQSNGRGFARAMMQELEERARSLGVRYLYLDTSISQIPAQRLYRSCGYREVGQVDKSGYACIVFDKDLIPVQS